VHPLFALGCVPWLVLAYRTFRIGVYTSSDGVLVRNVLRSRRVPWGEIERFDWGTWSGFPIGGVYLRDGRFVRAFALNPPFDTEHGADKTVRRALAALNDELARARTAGSSSREPSSDAAAPGTQQLTLDN
jgi:Bacterial PH domain